MKLVTIALLLSGKLSKILQIHFYENPPPKKANTCIERKVYYAGAFCNFPQYERLNGGLEGNRTPVRKPLDMTFSVKSPCF